MYEEGTALAVETAVNEVVVNTDKSAEAADENPTSEPRTDDTDTDNSEILPPLDLTTATGIASAVQNGSVTAEQMVDQALARIRAQDRKVNAFSEVRVDAARAEARALAERPNLDVLPLAGVPVAVKNNVDVTGAVTRAGSLAGSERPAAADHPVVRRLRSAGAVIVGLTTVPEFGLWGVTDTPDRITRSPWNSRYSAGGSSGGSGAAVGSGMVTIAHGNDGLGSVRIPAACSGVVGMKPGRGLVPAEVGVDSWGGMTENGVLATTVADAALMLSVLADRPALAELESPKALRIGLATAAPNPLTRVDKAWIAAADKAAAAASTAGHTIGVAELPYQGATFALGLRWVANAAREAGTVAHPERLQRRTRTHIALGRTVLKSGLLRAAQVDRIEARLLDYFERYDVAITPTLATPPPRARRWHSRPWLANVVASARFSPFTPLWNLVGWPAISVPMGVHPKTGTPVAAQLIGPPGSESTLLKLAAQLEDACPWERTAPGKD
ncbi:amidase family protein [Nocardia sp. NBC_01503]|uniref:amidase n=1 Tax=Nocardia sp. NBC_01503 TaxID=2975997 RepID=UPI002E7B9B71|nr:amidase family protein [Nocardia sp. NBC_01503]WTL34382.1 amidase family protein [Nocardia sp. NBC_01503]